MSFNSLSVLHVDSFRGLSVLNELRLEGNFIASFPWESLTDMPNLRLLDLHDNKITSIPAEAAVYVKNLTYLDLSSNSLSTLPSEVLLMWFSAKPAQDAENSKMILGKTDHFSDFLCISVINLLFYISIDIYICSETLFLIPQVFMITRGSVTVACLTWFSSRSLRLPHQPSSTLTCAAQSLIVFPVCSSWMWTYGGARYHGSTQPWRRFAAQ